MTRTRGGTNNVIVDPGTSSEAWAWALYPLEGQAYGPFVVSPRDGYSSWEWEMDDETERKLDANLAVLAVVGCAEGAPVGATAE